ncbi:MAG: DsbA family protein [Solirubrobacteraceae bacterium]
MQHLGPRMAEQPIFYYDLGSPECYLVAEQVMHALPVPPEWEPVRSSALTSEPEPIDRVRIERLAGTMSLQPVRWPPELPPQSELAMLAATYAKQIGRAVAFSLAAFRQAFAAGRDLGAPDTVLIAGAACEMHPTALLKALERRSVAQALQTAGARARRAGVRSLPAIQVGEGVFCGTDALKEAAGAVGHAAPASQAHRP